MAEKKSRDRVTDGRACGRPAQHPDRLLTEVWPGTPMGELMRRYWQPVGVSRRLGALPQRAHLLGEDLVLSRSSTASGWGARRGTK